MALSRKGFAMRFKETDSLQLVFLEWFLVF